MMRQVMFCVLWLCLAACTPTSTTQAPPRPSAESVKALTQKVADWQIETFYEQGKYRALAFDDKGYPHIAYALYLANNDQRHRLASWDGQKWSDRQVAHAGTRLYEQEASYTGLITLDPTNP